MVYENHDLYGCETLKVDKGVVSKLQLLINRKLRYLCSIWWPKKMTNKKLWRTTERRELEKKNIKRRK